MKVLKILGLDFETQGFPAEKTNVTEVGAVLVEVKVHEDVNGQPVDRFPSRSELARFNALMYDSTYPPQSREIVELTGITDTLLREQGLSPKAAIQEVLKLMAAADIVMTHNVQFDRAVFEEQCRRAGLEVPTVKWFCSLRDINYPKKFSCKKLGHLALDHGVKMDYRELHRATDDVELMLDLVLGKYHILDLLDYHSQPKVTIKIDIPKPWTDGEAGKSVAIANGYAWDAKRSAWVKEILQKNFQLEKDAVQYRVSVLA